MGNNYSTTSDWPGQIPIPRKAADVEVFAAGAIVGALAVGAVFAPRLTARILIALLDPKSPADAAANVARNVRKASEPEL